MIKKIVSTCSKKDIKTWQIVAKNILKYIDAEKYELIVPDREIEDFELVTPSEYHILMDSEYIDQQTREDFQNIFPKNLQGIYGYGWYIQQFLKILSCAAENPHDIVLIWDADTIPLRKIEFLNNEGLLTYYKSTKLQKLPYFNMIQNILGLPKVTSASFIAQCFPLYAKWASETISEITNITEQQWIKAIAANISNESSFSEYETLGTYIFSKYPHMVTFNNRPWKRYGARFFQNPQTINQKTLDLLSYKFDFIAVEQWDFIDSDTPIKRKFQQKLAAQIVLTECLIKKSFYSLNLTKASNIS